MIDTKTIWNNLLESAIRGKLSNTFTTSDPLILLDQIESEYRDALKTNNTKTKRDVQMITEGTYDLPNGWIWVPLNKLCVFLSRGKSPKYSDFKKYPVFAQKCNQPSGLALDKALFLDETTIDKWQDYFHLLNGDILINSTGTGTMGRVGYYLDEKLNKNYPFMVPDSHVTVVRLGKGLNSKFVYYVLKSQTLQNIMEKQFRGSTNQKEFYIDSVSAIPIPLPSKETQDILVSLLNKASAILITIDELQSKYIDNLSVLKSKLFVAAIQGKLTEQLPEDGTAEELYQRIQEEKQKLIMEGKVKKEKPLPEISEEEIPFEIPDNWKWVRLAELCSIINGDRGKNYPAKSTLKHEGIPFISALNLDGVSVTKDENLLCLSDQQYELLSNGKLQKDDIVICIRGSLGKHGRYPFEKGAIASSLVISRLFYSKEIMGDYEMVWLDSSAFPAEIKRYNSGVAQPNLAANSLAKFLIPLPPLAEQERIVTRLNEILKMIEA